MGARGRVTREMVRPGGCAKSEGWLRGRLFRLQRGNFTRPSLLDFRHEFLLTVGAPFAPIFDGLADRVIHLQGLAGFGEQRRAVGKLIHEIMDLLFQRHARSVARFQSFSQLRISFLSDHIFEVNNRAVSVDDLGWWLAGLKHPLMPARAGSDPT